MISLLLTALPLALFGQIVVNEPIPQTATIRVDVAVSAGPDIPRTIFGTFLEPVRNSTYNGLWAEILQNPSLESGLWDAPHIAQMLRDEPSLARASQLGLPIPWEPLDPDEGNRYQVHYGDAANSWQSLVLYGLPDRPVGIRQKVYLPVQRTLSYRGSLYARHLSGSEAIAVSIRPRNSAEVLASARIVASVPQWTKYSFTLTLPGGKLHRLDPADFAVQLEGAARVDLDEFSLMPADARGGLDPDAVALAKAMDTPLVRFGGNFTSTYNWRDGIGPRDKRVSMRNLAWGIPEYNTFGTDEFLHFCESIGAEPQIALNLGGGTPEQAAAWVRYVDEHWHRHSGLLWELGNELWGNWNLGNPTLEQSAARTLAFSRAVRQVDPSARLIATGVDPDRLDQRWNALQLGNPAGTFNYLSTHFVVTTSETDLPQASTDSIDEAAFALPVELGRKVKQDQDQIDRFPAFAHNARVAFTEWLFIGGAPGAPDFANMGGAVDTGGFLNMLMRHSAIVPIADMTGIMDLAGISKSRGQVYAAPAYYAFRMYSTADAVHLVHVAVDSGSYSVKNGMSRLPDIPNVPFLDVVAATSADGSTLDLFCVNRSTATDIPANIVLDRFMPDGVAQIQTLRASYLDESNDADDPTRVIPHKSSQPLQNTVLHHVFPHESVTVIAIRRAR